MINKLFTIESITLYDTILTELLMKKSRLVIHILSLTALDVILSQRFMKQENIDKIYR